jgi:WD40 repeat protein
MARTQCLTSAELAAFHLGDLPEADLEELSEHLEQCLRCQEAAAALDGLSDPTVAAYCRSARKGPLPEGESLPQRVDDYEVLAEVGRGGMGIVYRARHVRLRRVVALKMLLGGHFGDRDQCRRFRAEAEAVARLQHPHIVQLFEIGEHEVGAGLPRPYFTLELVEGGNLDERLAGRPLPPSQAAGWLEPLARAVHYAHEQSILHRDLNPSNILLTGDGRPKICDFGVAKLLTGSDLKTLSGMILGTAEYMAPEQARGTGPLGPACDIYALGAILYEMLTGRPPFKGATTLDTLHQVQTQEPVPIRHLQPLVPRDLETICLKCLEKEPARRYASAGALAEDLRRFLAQEPIVARPIRWQERSLKWARRRPAVAALGAAVVAAVVPGLAGVGWQWHQALAERTRAVRLADDLRTQRDAAEWQTYRANIAAALSALQVHNTAAARRYLDDAPEPFRNWEWRHLVSRLDDGHGTLRGHGDQVLTLAFSPDGHLATGSKDRTVRVWDLATGRTAAVLRGHEDTVCQLVFSPDGRRLASADRTGNTVRLWHRDGRPLAVLPGPVLPGRALSNASLTFSPDGRVLGCCGEGGTVCLWDATTGAPRHVLRHRTGRSESIAFSPDGKQLVCASSGGNLTVWDVATGEVRLAWKAHSAVAATVDFSPDGKYIASGGDYPDNKVCLWDAATGRERAALAGHKNRVHRVAFSPDGARILSASWDQTARLWDVGTGRLLAVLQGHRGRVTDMVFHPKNAQVVTRAEDQTLRLWDARTGELLAMLGGVAVLAWERCLAFSPDGTRLACAAEDGTVRLWDLDLVERNGVLRGHTSYVYDAAFSPDGTQVASAAWDGTVRLWDTATQQQTALLKHDEGIVSSVAFSPDGKQLTSVTRGRVYLWDLAAARPKRVWPASLSGYEETRAVFSPDGSLIAAGSGQASARVWDASSGRAVAEWGGGVNSSDVAFSPDGAQLVSAERGGTVRLWDVATGQPAGLLRGHTALVWAVRFSADGSLLASAGEDHTVRLWDAKTHAALAVLPHGGPVYGLAFSPDGTRLATACRDNTIRLWDLTTREEVAELHGHTDYVHAVAFSRDGTRLVSCSGDFTVRLWDTLSPHTRARSPAK